MTKNSEHAHCHATWYSAFYVYPFHGQHSISHKLFTVNTNEMGLLTKLFTMQAESLCVFVIINVVILNCKRAVL